MRRTTTRRFRAGLAAGLAAAALTVTACSSATAPSGAEPTASAATPTASTTGNPYGDGTAIDPPARGETVLEVAAADGSTTAWSLRQLDRLGTQEITIQEPFVKQQQTFTGVPLATILERAGVPADAAIETIALNDYRYTADAAALTASQALVATTRDGSPIPMDQGGPIRLVFPDGTALSTDLDAWNWSLAEIRVA